MGDMEAVSKEMFDELLRVGALKISPEEAELLRADLNGQLMVIQLLDSIPLDAGLSPVVHGNPYPEEIRCSLREDVPCVFDRPGDILARAPLSREGFFVSPDVPHQKLENPDRE